MAEDVDSAALLDSEAGGSGTDVESKAVPKSDRGSVGMFNDFSLEKNCSLVHRGEWCLLVCLSMVVSSVMVNQIVLHGTFYWVC